jgi:hypothetical protein
MAGALTAGKQVYNEPWATPVRPGALRGHFECEAVPDEAARRYFVPIEVEATLSASPGWVDGMNGTSSVRHRFSTPEEHGTTEPCPAYFICESVGPGPPSSPPAYFQNIPEAVAVYDDAACVPRIAPPSAKRPRGKPVLNIEEELMGDLVRSAVCPGTYELSPHSVKRLIEWNLPKGEEMVLNFLKRTDVCSLGKLAASDGLFALILDRFRNALTFQIIGILICLLSSPASWSYARLSGAPRALVLKMDQVDPFGDSDMSTVLLLVIEQWMSRDAAALAEMLKLNVVARAARIVDAIGCRGTTQLGSACIDIMLWGAE